MTAGQGGWRGAVGAYRSRAGLGGAARRRSRCRPAPPTSAGSSRWCCAPRPTARRSASRTARPGASRSPQMRWARPLRDDGTLGAVAAQRRRRRQAGRSRAGRGTAGAKPAKGRARPASRTRRPALYNLCQIPEVSGALVAIDPHTGRVLAMSGGFSFETEPVQPRHPGQAAAGLVDQAVRLSDRARTRLHAVDAGRRRADLDQPGPGHADLDAGRTTPATGSAGRRRCASRSKNR